MNRIGNTIATFILLAASSQAGIITYTAVLNGVNESPTNSSLGTGFTTVVFNNVTNTLSVNVTFTGLTGTTTASHIHCCTAVALTGTAGVATETPTFGGFPLGVTSGTYSNLYDLTLLASWNTPFVTANGGTAAGAEAAFAAGLAGGKAYLNIHSSFAPGGEIRGFLVATPEPATWGLIGASLLALGAARKRLQKQ